MVAAPAVGFPETVFPVLAVERNLQHLAPAAAMPRILTSDQWADYLIYRLYPQQRVFFDGRSDFFGPAIGSDYRKLLAGERPWRELLDRYRFDLALLPRDWALSTALDREPGWRLVYQDSVAVLYARDVARTPGRALARWTAAIGAIAADDGYGPRSQRPRAGACHDGRHRHRCRPRSGRGPGGSASPPSAELADRGGRGRRTGLRRLGRTGTAWVWPPPARSWDF